MGNYFMAIRSSITNSALAVLLEISIVLLGQNVYHAWVNDQCRRQLISEGSARIYKRGTKYSLYISAALIFIVCESIELGIYGESGRYVSRVLHPSVNLSGSAVSEWTGHEYMDKNPADIKLSDFPVLEERRRCIRKRPQNQLEFVDYFAYGREGCFDTIAYPYGSNLKVADVAMNTIDVTVRFLDMVEEGVEDFVSVQFGDTLQTSVTFRVESFRNKGYNPEPAFVTFAVLLNKEYDSSDGNIKGNETMAVVFWESKCSTGPIYCPYDDILYKNPCFHNHRQRNLLMFQVMSFSDVFITPWTSNTTVLTPRNQVQVFSWFEITTYHTLNSTPNCYGGMRVDNEFLSSRKVFYALSKLHFALEPNPRNSSAFMAHLISEIDRPLSPNSTIPQLSAAVFSLDHDIVVTWMVPYAVFELFIAMLLLSVARIVFWVKNCMAPLSVNLFDVRYMAALKLGDQTLMKKYCKEGYNVFMERCIDGNYELKLEVELNVM